MQTERDTTAIQLAAMATIEREATPRGAAERRYPVQLRPTFVRLPRRQLVAA